jgi:membrane protein YdbS with pleckstrin-like domain
MRTRLRPGEEVAAVVRRHWIILSGPFGLSLFLFGALIAAGFVHRTGLVPALAALLACGLAWAAWRWLDWRCDLWAVTTHRVIDESGVLAVRMIDSPLDTIHNVTCEQSLLGRLLGYGTVNIQTAAEHGATTIRDVAGPLDLRATVLDLKERYRQGRGPQAAGRAAWAPGGGPPAAGDTKECPYCAETIKVRATVCRFCGRTL